MRRITLCLCLFLLSFCGSVWAQDVQLPFRIMATGTADFFNVTRATSGRMDVIVDDQVWQTVDLSEGVAEFTVPFDQTSYLTLRADPFGTWERGVRISFDNGAMLLDRNIGGTYDGNGLIYYQSQDGNFAFDWLEDNLWVTAPGDPGGPIIGPTYLGPNDGIKVNKSGFGNGYRIESRFEAFSWYPQGTDVFIGGVINFSPGSTLSLQTQNQLWSYGSTTPDRFRTRTWVLGGAEDVFAIQGRVINDSGCANTDWLTGMECRRTTIIECGSCDPLALEPIIVDHQFGCSENPNPGGSGADEVVFYSNPAGRITVQMTAP